MFNKKILLSFLLVVLIALSVSSVSADDVTDDVVAAEDISDDVLAADPITPANDTFEGVQDAVTRANKTGDIVDLSGNAEYDFAGNTVNIINSNIVIDGKGTTTIKGYGNGNGLFYVTGTNVTIKGIHFIDTNPNNNFKYGGSVNGYAIKFSDAEDSLVKDCKFGNFSSAVYVSACDGITIKDNYFYGGYATLLVNDPTVNKEQGSKVVNIGGSTGVTVENNTFNGTMLDGVSIAQGSGGNNVIGNKFIGNVYAIFFGGDSTKNSIIKDNTFENCGVFKEGTILYERFPVISIEKASSDITITENTFYAVDNSVLIAAEQGNDAHGYPSSLSNVTVANNIVQNKTAVEPDTIILLRIKVRDNNVLQPVLPVVVQNNTLPKVIKPNGKTSIEAQAVVVLFSLTDLTLENNVVTPVASTITVTNPSIKAGDAGKLQITLKDANGVLANTDVLVIIDGVTKTAKTNDKGIATLDVKYAAAGTHNVVVSYAGDDTTKSSISTGKITVTKKATALSASKATLKVKKAKKVKVTLKSGKTLIANKKVTIKVNGKTFSAKTNSKGVATISVKVAKKGKFTAAISFAGDGAYSAAKTVKVKYTVK